MGELQVSKLSSKKDKANYIFQLIKDIEALDLMIKDGLIEKSPIRIGAEQEFCLTNSEFKPSFKALDILKEIDDTHFTTEIGRFNLEINLDPLELKGACFSELHNNLLMLLEKAELAAQKHQSKILLTGILPTLSINDVTIESMTPIERYYVLNEAIKSSRKEDFNVHIKGVDEVNLRHDSVMLEGCNTSFQSHLQINPDEFIEKYNWAQAISGPILSICTNSPLLFGKELWSETRIALFTQSVDTRTNSLLLNEEQSRVSFGSEWATGSVADLYRDNISRFRSLITSEFTKNSVEMLKNGEIPKLKALNLHNGTVYRWNRPCYGVGGGKPHLRIENRYIPSGPTAIDEIANMMFWVGVMLGQPTKYKEIHRKMDFKDAKQNFFSAARYGMATQFYWDNKFVSSQNLILDELLPMAYRGLYSVGISPKDVEHYLGIIENRVKLLNGSQWILRSYRNLLQSKKPYEAAQVLSSVLYEKQKKEYPVSSWNILSSNTPSLQLKDKEVKHVMSTDIFTVDEKDSVELVLNIMKWKNIHHMPVINKNKDLVGLLSWKDVESCADDISRHSETIKDIMKIDLITIGQHDTIETASKLMNSKGISCLPVISGTELIGLLTSNDLKHSK